VVGGGWCSAGIAEVVSMELHGAGVTCISQSLEVGLVVVGALIEGHDGAGPVIIVDVLGVVVCAADRSEGEVGRHSGDDGGHAVAISFFQFVAEVNRHGNIGSVDARQ